MSWTSFVRFSNADSRSSMFLDQSVARIRGVARVKYATAPAVRMMRQTPMTSCVAQLSILETNPCQLCPCFPELMTIVVPLVPVMDSTPLSDVIL